MPYLVDKHFLIHSIGQHFDTTAGKQEVWMAGVVSKGYNHGLGKAAKYLGAILINLQVAFLALLEVPFKISSILTIPLETELVR